MNTATYITHRASPPAAQATQTRIGAGTFIVSRQYVGNGPVCALLEQCVQRAAHTTSSIDERSGTAV